MKNNFSEGKLGHDFCKSSVLDVEKLIENSTSFSVIGMPAMGISIFLKYLATLDFAYFIHIDINELSSPTETELFKQIPSKEELAILTKKHSRIVIIFNRFDRLKKQFSQSFFARLRSLRDIDREKIVMIFAANRPLTEQAPKAVEGGNLNMFSKTYFLKPYLIHDLEKLLKLNSPKLLKHPMVKRALELSGGHYQLLQLLLKLDSLENPLSDTAVKLQLKELYEFLNYTRRKQLQKIALGKSIKELDKYLVDIGYIGKSLFTPLMVEYIKAHIRIKLPLQENRLFQLLRKKEGKLVTKNEIFENLWTEGEGTDWALNALIYRLRKNPTFSTSGYIIESYKKVGYSLVRV